ncbi:hypothetical protein [Bdellovibrio sp. HCB209]|uniref:hypothetical protein n=1 Tax=Bdellovibrio sp. HCB209 TaxID=3394354 RepID=UPI0039B5537C
MSKKLVCLSLAGLMTMQSVAFAQTDRTAVATDKAISQAQDNIAALRANLGQLDLALAETAKTVDKRDHSGGIFNAATIIGAGIGLGFTALSFVTSRSGHEGSGLGALMGISVSLVSAVASIATGTTSALLKKDIETGKVDRDLENLQAQIAQNMKGADKGTASLLQQLSISVVGMRETLASYQSSEDSTDRVKLGSHVAQGVGAILLVYALTDRAGYGQAKLGLILMSAGNIGRIVSGMSDSQADVVLREIKLTRTSIQSAVQVLE